MIGNIKVFVILQDQRHMVVSRLVYSCYYLLTMVAAIVFWAVVVNHRILHRMSSSPDVSSFSVC